MVFAKHVLEFTKGLALKNKLPEGVHVLNPYTNSIAFNLCSLFYTKYYNDLEERTLIFGINPGRFGGGLTGIPFTDPLKLETICEIPNSLQKKTELSADFIYRMISAYGGPTKFYEKFFFTAVCPLGFTKDGKNLNYYDVKELQAGLMDFIIERIKTQLTFNVNKKIAYCLGESDNFKFLSKLNTEHNFFKAIIPLPHPRFIMQYKRKYVENFIEIYIKKLGEPVR
jgi:hypothetical protein